MTGNITNNKDMTIMAVGAAAWACAVPAVQMAGRGLMASSSHTSSSKDEFGFLVSRAAALLVGIGIAAGTTPLLSYLLHWQTPSEKVRGIALALGTAQVIDGLVHLFAPDFYDKDPRVGLACAGNIFYGAGLLGIFSAFQ